MSIEHHAALINFASGAAAGLADTLINYPPYALHYHLGRGANIWSQIHYWRPRELYRGVLAYSSIIPVTCITDGLSSYFAAQGLRQDLAALLAGMCAAAVVSAPVGNCIVTAQRLAEEGRAASSVDAARAVWRSHGVKGFYTGLGPLMARESIYAWAVFSGKADLQRAYNLGDLQAACASGTIASLLSQPMDTLATVMQNQSPRKTAWACVQAMYQEQGLRRFYRGFYFRWVAIISGVYVMDAVSQRTKRLLEK